MVGGIVPSPHQALGELQGKSRAPDEPLKVMHRDQTGENMRIFGLQSSSLVTSILNAFWPY